MNNRRFLLVVAMGLVLALLFAVSATAASTLTFKGEIRGDANFTGPGELTVSILVSNSGDEDMPGPVKLLYPDMTEVEEFGSPTLAAGTNRSWEGSWNVTQKELEAGHVDFYVTYAEKNEETGEIKQSGKKLKFTINYSGAEPELAIERSFLPSVAQKNQEVSVIYKITNNGAAEVSNVTIKENKDIATTAGAIKSIAPGETKEFVFTAKMGTKDLTSQSTVSYKAGGKSYSTNVEAATVKYGVMDLSASLSADKKGGAPGDTVKLKLTLKNSGKGEFTNVTVTDAVLGSVFSGETVKAGETKVLEKDLTVTETTNLQFIVKAEGADGNTVETATGRVHVIATDPTKQIVLNVEASADRSEVYKIPGGVVRFTITVDNKSAVDVKDISVKAVDRQVYKFDVIPSGESRSFTRDMEISMAGTFQFTANTKDELNQTLTFSSNPIQIAYAPPTPVPTEAPLVTPVAPGDIPMPQATAAPQWIGQAEQAADTAKWVFTGIAGVLGVLLLIGAVRRGHSKSQSKKAMDHLEGATYRDYGAAPRRRRRNEVISGEEDRREEPAAAPEEKPEEPAEEPAEADQGSELMAETLKRLYNESDEKTVEEFKAEAEGAVKEAEEAVKAEAEPAAQTMAEATRRRRADRK